MKSGLDPLGSKREISCPLTHFRGRVGSESFEDRELPAYLPSVFPRPTSTHLVRRPFPAPVKGETESRGTVESPKNETRAVPVQRRLSTRTERARTADQSFLVEPLTSEIDVDWRLEPIRTRPIQPGC